MGSCWAILEHLGAILEPSWAHLGPMLGHLGPILGPCWAILRPCWAYVGPSWGHVGPRLGQIRAHLGPSWGYVGTRGVPSNFFLSNLCCFFRRAKNTVNYEVFFGYTWSAVGAGSRIAKASGLRPGALPVYRACWPDLRG